MTVTSARTGCVVVVVVVVMTVVFSTDKVVVVPARTAAAGPGPSAPGARCSSMPSERGGALWRANCGRDAGGCAGRRSSEFLEVATDPQPKATCPNTEIGGGRVSTGRRGKGRAAAKDAALRLDQWKAGPHR